MLHLSDKDLALIKSILSKYPYQFYAFGSRVKGKQKKYSDLDLCYKDAIPDAVISKMHEDFEETPIERRQISSNTSSNHRNDPIHHRKDIRAY